MNTRAWLAAGALLFASLSHAEEPQRLYQNSLRRLTDPRRLLADHPEFVAPVEETTRYEAPALVDDPSADLDVRAWRYSYNARGIIEMPNHLLAAHTAVVFVHPWGIDDGQGWRTPEPAGAADFCTLEKNHLAARHTREVIVPFIHSLNEHVKFVLHSLPGAEDPIRHKLYRSFTHTPTDEDRAEGQRELDEKLHSSDYRGQPLPGQFHLSAEHPVTDYFKQFPGLDAGPRFDGEGFWQMPIPITRDADSQPDDIVIYDEAGYAPLKAFLLENGIRHILLVGYATDMCYCRTTAGYENLRRDFNVFLVGDATLATFPANASPAHATNAHISHAALENLVTQVSWVKLKPGVASTQARAKKSE